MQEEGSRLPTPGGPPDTRASSRPLHSTWWGLSQRHLGSFVSGTLTALQSEMLKNKSLKAKQTPHLLAVVRTSQISCHTSGSDVKCHFQKHFIHFPVRSSQRCQETKRICIIQCPTSSPCFSSPWGPKQALLELLGEGSQERRGFY